MARKRKKRICWVTGKTEDGALLISGVFKLSDTHGIPLEISLDAIRDRGMMCDWMQFYKDALAQGWTTKSTLSKLREAIGDVYGPDWREEWELRMTFWVKQYHAKLEE